MSNIHKIFAGLIFILAIAGAAFAQCPAGAQGCNLVCAVSFGFGNSTYCALVDDTGNVYQNLSFFPPCVKPGCFPAAQALVRTSDGNIGSFMMQGSSSGVYSFTLSRMSVNPQLVYLQSKTIPKPAAMNVTGYPILQAVRTADRTHPYIGYIRRSAGKASANAPKIAAFSLIQLGDDELEKEIIDILRINEDEFEIIGGSIGDQDQGLVAWAVVRLRNKKTGEVIEKAVRIVDGVAKDTINLDVDLEPVNDPSPPRFSLDPTPVETTAIMGTGAGFQRFVLYRLIRLSGGSFQSQVYLRVVDDASGKPGPLRNIAPRAKTVQPTAEAFQSVAIDPNKRFAVYSYSDPNCGGALVVRFQRLNPATGTKIGPPRSVIGCSQLKTTITGLYGLDIMNLQ